MRLERTGENEYTERPGLSYEEFVIGTTIKHWPGRTITEADNTWLTLLLMNRNPIHFDAEYAKSGEYGRVLVNSSITLALIGGMTVETLSSRAINLGWDKVRIKAPVFVGDTLYARSKILSKRQSRSRPSQGIVTVETVGYKTPDEVVMVFERSLMIPIESSVPASADETPTRSARFGQS